VANRISDLLRRSERAIPDSQLQHAIDFATSRLRDHRSKIMPRMKGWEEMREQARQLRLHTLAHLDEYLEALERKVLQRGGQVFWARDAQEASQYVIDLARRRGVRNLVKTKSMVTEEIQLNKSLERNGIQPVETDLGEYIVQLAGETPSHLIAPAFHKNKEQVAEIFSRHFGTPIPAEVKPIMAVARKELRGKFLAAPMGITGANFAVAETGTLVLVTNEGNGRLTSFLPPILVSILGMEKVVPRLADLEVLLNVLVPSATGQRLTTYVSLLSPPRRLDETRGPQEFHLIILDNGRSSILGGPFADILTCVRCGACLNVCPVYQKIGGHSYGSTYTGPMGAVLSPLLSELKNHESLPHASTLCGACAEVCPVKIPIPDLLIGLRQAQVRQGKAPLAQSLIFSFWSWLWSRPWGYTFSARLAHVFRPLIGTGRKFPVVSGWASGRDLPPPAPRTFRDRWRERDGSSRG